MGDVLQGYTAFGRWLVKRGAITRALFRVAVVLPWYLVAGAVISVRESWDEWVAGGRMMERDADRFTRAHRDATGDTP